jgi:hypothetical protein
MGWLKNSWVKVKELLYEYNAPDTVSKYYLYIYLTEYLNVKELEYDLFVLENNLYDACLAYLFWHTIGDIMFFTPRVEPSLCNTKIYKILKESERIRHETSEMLYNQYRSKLEELRRQRPSAARPSEKEAELEDYIIFEAITKQIEYIDQHFPTLQDIRQIILEFRDVICSEDVEEEYVEGGGCDIYRIFRDLNELSKRIIIDNFFAIAHASGMFLVHRIISIYHPSACYLGVIFDYVREGNIYALYDYLTRIREIKLHSIVYRYARFLPGEQFDDSLCE